MALNLIVCKSEEILNRILNDNSKHAQYVSKNFEKISEKIYFEMQKVRREHFRNQYKSHLKAKECYLYC